MLYKVGDKVIPFQKTSGFVDRAKSLNTSIVWRNAKDCRQEYLTVKEVNPTSFAELGLAYTYSDGSLSSIDYFNECDVKPYIVKKVMNK